jgi:hypothetical protein
VNWGRRQIGVCKIWKDEDVQNGRIASDNYSEAD